MQRFEQACAQADRARAVQMEAATLPWHRWRQRRTILAAATHDHARAMEVARSARRQFGRHGVGGRPGTWGVLSGAAGFYLESTLEELSWEHTLDSAASSDVGELLRELPRVRLAAHGGDRQGEVEVQRVVRSLADGAPDRKVRRRLIEHLPADARPVPASIDELDRRGHPITVLVTDDLSPTLEWRDEQPYTKQRIKLHDIVSNGDLRGLGLGSAALQELCRYADAAGMEIIGDVWPGPGFDDYETRVPRLAAWYTRHGFQVGSIGQGPAWTTAFMVREPCTNRAVVNGGFPGAEHQ